MCNQLQDFFIDIGDMLVDTEKSLAFYILCCQK